MMTQSLKGKKGNETEDLLHRFLRSAAGQNGNEHNPEFDKFAAISGIADFQFE
jgi:hypothetical protein